MAENSPGGGPSQTAKNKKRHEKKKRRRSSGEHSQPTGSPPHSQQRTEARVLSCLLSLVAQHVTCCSYCRMALCLVRRGPSRRRRYHHQHLRDHHQHLRNLRQCSRLQALRMTRACLQRGFALARMDGFTAANVVLPIFAGLLRDRRSSSRRRRRSPWPLSSLLESR